MHLLAQLYHLTCFQTVAKKYAFNFVFSASAFNVNKFNNTMTDSKFCQLESQNTQVIELATHSRNRNNGRIFHTSSFHAEFPAAERKRQRIDEGKLQLQRLPQSSRPQSLKSGNNVTEICPDRKIASSTSPRYLFSVYRTRPLLA